MVGGHTTHSTKPFTALVRISSAGISKLPPAGRVYIYLLLELAKEKSPMAKLTPAALFKWAQMLANGKSVNLLTVPPEVQARATVSAFSDDEAAPTCRAKKKGKPDTEMLQPPASVQNLASKHIIGLPSPAADKLISWAAGPVSPTILPSRENGDADPEKWVTATMKVLLLQCLFLMASQDPSTTPHQCLQYS